MSRFVIATLLLIGMSCWSFGADNGQRQGETELRRADKITLLKLQLRDALQRLSIDHPHVRRLQHQLELAQVRNDSDSPETATSVEDLQERLEVQRREIESLRRRISDLERTKPQPLETLVVNISTDEGREALGMLIQQVHAKYRVKLIQAENRPYRVLEVEGIPTAIQFVRQAAEFLNGTAPTENRQQVQQARPFSDTIARDPRRLGTRRETAPK